MGKRFCPWEIYIPIQESSNKQMNRSEAQYVSNEQEGEGRASVAEWE